VGLTSLKSTAPINISWLSFGSFPVTAIKCAKSALIREWSLLYLSVLGKVTFHVVVVHFLLPGVDFFGGGMQPLVLVVWIGQTIPTVPAGATAADRDIAK
jgi:hypothetical protein